MDGEDALRSCCFTGHRPEKTEITEKELKSRLEAEIRSAVSDGFEFFISGMARGSDIIAAETVLNLKNEGAPVKLICAVPYEGFERRWGDFWKRRYLSVLAAADSAVYICPAFIYGCFQKRNIWMVDHSSRVIAVYGGGSGGTKNTLDYARSKGLDIKIILAEQIK